MQSSKCLVHDSWANERSVLQVRYSSSPRKRRTISSTPLPANRVPENPSTRCKTPNFPQHSLLKRKKKRPKSKSLADPMRGFGPWVAEPDRNSNQTFVNAVNMAPQIKVDFRWLSWSLTVMWRTLFVYFCDGTITLTVDKCMYINFHWTEGFASCSIMESGGFAPGRGVIFPPVALASAVIICRYVE